MNERIKDPLGVVDKWNEAAEPESREWADVKYSYPFVLGVVGLLASVTALAWIFVLRPLFG